MENFKTSADVLFILLGAIMILAMHAGFAERARFNSQLAATFLLVGFIYPFFEGIAWNQAYGIQAWLLATFGAEFHDFAGSVVVHAVGGWVGLAAVLMLGARRSRYHKDGGIAAGIFGAQALGGMGGVAFMSQLVGTLLGVAVALIGGFAIYGGLKATVGLRLDAEEEFEGADLTIHKVSASAERETLW